MLTPKLTQYNVNCMMEASTSNRKPIGLRYGEVEWLFLTIYNVSDDDEKAFRAKLRHMRNIGIPSGIGKIGRGRNIRFSKKQLLEMLFSLDMQNIGMSPSDTRELSRLYAEEAVDIVVDPVTYGQSNRVVLIFDLGLAVQTIDRAIAAMAGATCRGDGKWL